MKVAKEVCAKKNEDTNCQMTVMMQEKIWNDTTSNQVQKDI